MFSPSNYVKIVDILESTPRVYRMKSLSKLGLIRVGVEVVSSFTSSKLALPSFIQEKDISFFNMAVRGFTMVARLGMNLLTKLILPKKLYNPFL